MPPARYMKEKARSLPVAGCYRAALSPSREAVIVSRRRPSGNIVYCLFTIETLCLGIVDITVQTNATKDEWSALISSMLADSSLKEWSYPEAHNFILAAADFTEEAGLSLPPQWEIAQYILDDDTDDIPIIDFDFGRNGGHVLTDEAAADITPAQIETLRRTLGDSFLNLTSVSDSSSYSEQMRREAERHPHLSYLAPKSFPKAPPLKSIRNQKLRKLLGGHLETMIDAPTVDAILALKDRGLTADLNTIILREIAATRSDADQQPYRSELFDACLVLLDCADEAVQPALEVLTKLDEDFFDYHFGDCCFEILPTVYARAFASEPERLEALFRRPGHTDTVQTILLTALFLVPAANPAMRPWVADFVNRLLDEAPALIRANRVMDAQLAAVLVCEMQYFFSADDSDVYTKAMCLYDLDLIDLSYIRRDDVRPSDEPRSLNSSSGMRAMCADETPDFIEPD